MIFVAPKTVEPGTEKLMLKRVCRHCKGEHIFLGAPAYGQACPICNKWIVSACDFCAKSSRNRIDGWGPCSGGCSPQNSLFTVHPKYLLPAVEEPGLEES